MADIAGFFKKTLPSMAAAVASGIPGPIGAVASIISAKLGKDVKPDADSISAAIAGATPDQILKLKEDDQQFQETIQKMGFEHEEDLANAAYGDRANARAREVQSKDSWTPRIIAAFVILAWCVIEGFILWHAFSGAPELNPANSQLVGAISRMADAAFMLVIGYYFGSSIGSQNKDATIQNLSK